MPRPNKTWGGSRTALQNRVQQSRDARSQARAVSQAADEMTQVLFQEVDRSRLIRHLGEGGVRAGELSVIGGRRMADRGIVAYMNQRDQQAIREMTRRMYGNVGLDLNLFGDFDPTEASPAELPSRGWRVQESPIDTSTPDGEFRRIRRTTASLREERFTRYSFPMPLGLAQAQANPINVDECSYQLYETLRNLILRDSELNRMFMKVEDSFLKKLKAWSYHLANKVFGRDPAFQFPIVKCSTPSGRVRYETRRQSVLERGLNCSSKHDYDVCRIVVPKWLQASDDAFSNPTSRPVFIDLDSIIRGDLRLLMKAKPGTTFSMRNTLLGMTMPANTVFASTDNAFARNTYEVYPRAKNYGLWLIQALYGFLKNHDKITRPWAEYDLEKWAHDSYVEFRIERYKKLSAEFSQILEQSRTPVYYIGDFFGHPYVVIPLKERDLISIDGHMMEHCASGNMNEPARLFYSIRQARLEDGKYIPTYARITFDVTLELELRKDQIDPSDPNFSRIPLKMTPRLGSIKGACNMNNARWRPVIEAAGHLLGMPELGQRYIVTPTKTADEEESDLP